MSLQLRLEALVAAVGADIKALQSSGGGSAAAWTPHYPMTPVPGVLYFPVAGANATQALTQSRLYYMPFTVSRAVKLSSWGVDVTTVATGSTLRSSIYSNATALDPAGRPYILPGNKLVDASATAVGTATGVKTFSATTAPALDPSLIYWMAVVAQGGAPTLRARNSSDPFVTDRSSTVAQAVNTCYWQGAITGATPAVAPDYTGLACAQGPSFWCQFAELP